MQLLKTESISSSFGLNKSLGINPRSPRITTNVNNDSHLYSRYLAYNKDSIKKALTTRNLPLLIDYSNNFYRVSGRYKRLIDTNASLYRYDYFVTPFCKDGLKNKKKLEVEFKEILIFLEKYNPKEKFLQYAKNVLINGSFYGYKVYDENNSLHVQELPVKYCDSSFKQGDKDVVMLDMNYFRKEFGGYTPEMLESIVKTFPNEIRLAWNKYKDGKLKGFVFNNHFGHWVALNPKNTIRFSFDEDLYPQLIQVLIPIIGLEESISLIRKRYSNSLKGIIVSKFPLKQNDTPVASMQDMATFNFKLKDELTSKSEDLTSISTIADTELLKNDTKSTTNEGKELVDTAINEIYDEAGISQMQFNSDNSTALKFSINNDEANMGFLVKLFESFLNEIVNDYLDLIKSKSKVYYKVEILRTTCHNYLELSKAYKEQVQLGFAKVLPQVALGQSQLSILNTLEFENDILDLVNKLVPPVMSSTMSGNGSIGDSSGGTGRPQKANQEEKTLKNKEAKANN